MRGSAGGKPKEGVWCGDGLRARESVVCLCASVCGASRYLEPHFTCGCYWGFVAGQGMLQRRLCLPCTLHCSWRSICAGNRHGTGIVDNSVFVGNEALGFSPRT
ncbi:uncharacterized protein [Physcomitrium patens]|uniref:uncharacterized protein n=1 Tax=Physcomitrium patens TaxID=3218 RepID=UPI003CCDB8D6